MKLGDFMFLIPPFEMIRLIGLASNGIEAEFDYFRYWKDCKYMDCEVVCICSRDYYLQIEIKVGE